MKEQKAVTTIAAFPTPARSDGHKMPALRRYLVPEIFRWDHGMCQMLGFIGKIQKQDIAKLNAHKHCTWVFLILRILSEFALFVDSHNSDKIFVNYEC